MLAHSGKNAGLINTSLISRRWQFWIDREVLEEIRRLKQRLGLTAAYVTHDQSEALALSDQIIVWTTA